MNTRSTTALSLLLALALPACGDSKHSANDADGSDEIDAGDHPSAPTDDAGAAAKPDGGTQGGPDASSEDGSVQPAPEMSLAASILGADLVPDAIEAQNQADLTLPADLMPPTTGAFPADLLPPD